MSSADRLVSPREALTIARIVKVNHAGEYGAIRIYAAQIAVARRLYPVEIPALAEMREHEKRHCAAFRDAMPARRSRPCRVMALWSRGGWLLGFTTALLGRQGIWACTAAVEAAVHRHLDDQLHFLASRDFGLHELILSIRDEELDHLRHAEAQLAVPTAFQRLLRRVIGGVTDGLIWLSTGGDSARMARDLRRFREAESRRSTIRALRTPPIVGPTSVRRDKAMPAARVSASRKPSVRRQATSAEAAGAATPGISPTLVLAYPPQERLS